MRMIKPVWATTRIFSVEVATDEFERYGAVGVSVNVSLFAKSLPFKCTGVWGVYNFEIGEITFIVYIHA